MEDELLEVPEEFFQETEEFDINMNEIVGSHDILFICLDTLRYDVAKEEEEKGTTPVLNSYGEWTKCHAPGNFTYPSHHAMFSGFLPIPVEEKSMSAKNKLFFPAKIGLGNVSPKNSFAFEGATFIEGLEKVGYETICIGGVAFFDKRSDIGSVFPNMFTQSYWHPSFGCMIKESPDNQISKAMKIIDELHDDKNYFMYINIDAIHYPNYFYREEKRSKDDKVSHAEALKYVDERLELLFDHCKKRKDTFVIVCSDHGSCYGEDGITFHGLNHEIINTVQYKHFTL